MKTSSIRFVCLSLLLLVQLGAWASCRLHVVYSDVAAPPYLMGDGPVVPQKPGIAIELLRLAADSAKCELRLERLPNRRVQRMMEIGAVDAALMYSYNTERAVYSVYPMKDGKPDAFFRLAELNHYVYVNQSSTLTWDGKQFNPIPASLGVNSGYSIGADLIKAGYRVEDARSTEQNLKKLKLDRITAYVMQDEPADAAIESLGIGGIRKLPLPYSSKDYFLPFSKASHDRNPTTAAHVWGHIAETRRQHIKNLLIKYEE
jgi:polar amino acid transport system substrate-binding protein